jgi:hypothetical protein
LHHPLNDAMVEATPTQRLVFAQLETLPADTLANAAAFQTERIGASDISEIAIVRSFNRYATAEAKQSCTMTRGMEARKQFRRDWHTARLSNSTTKAMAIETDMKSDVKEGWYMNEDQICLEQGGQINLCNATLRTRNVVAYCTRKGPPYVLWNPITQTLEYLNMKRGIKDSFTVLQQTETTSDMDTSQVAPEVLDQALRSGIASGLMIPPADAVSTMTIDDQSHGELSSSSATTAPTPGLVTPQAVSPHFATPPRIAPITPRVVKPPNRDTHQQVINAFFAGQRRSASSDSVDGTTDTVPGDPFADWFDATLPDSQASVVVHTATSSTEPLITTPHAGTVVAMETPTEAPTKKLRIGHLLSLRRASCQWSGRQSLCTDTFEAHLWSLVQLQNATKP